MSNKMKVLESLHTLSDEDQTKAMQKLIDDKEAEHTPQAEMTVYNIADTINSLPDKYKTPIVEAVDNYVATGKEPDEEDNKVFGYLGVVVWEAIKHNIDTLKATQGGGVPQTIKPR